MSMGNQTDIHRVDVEQNIWERHNMKVDFNLYFNSYYQCSNFIKNNANNNSSQSDTILFIYKNLPKT